MSAEQTVTDAFAPDRAWLCRVGGASALVLGARTCSPSRSTRTWDAAARRWGVAALRRRRLRGCFGRARPL